MTSPQAIILGVKPSEVRHEHGRSQSESPTVSDIKFANENTAAREAKRYVSLCACDKATNETKSH